MKRLIPAFIAAFFSLVSPAQVKIGNNPGSIGSSSLLELESPNKALKLTGVHDTSRSYISNPVNGMLVYDSSRQCIVAFQNGAWSGCAGSGGSELISGVVSCSDVFQNIKSLGLGNYGYNGKTTTTAAEYFLTNNNKFYNTIGLYAKDGTTPTSIGSYYNLTLPIQAINTRYPTESWSDFQAWDNGSSSIGTYMFLLNAAGTLRAMRIASIPATGTAFNGLLGPLAYTAANTLKTTSAADDPYYTFQDFNTDNLGATHNWSNFQIVSGVAIASDATTNMVYTWGGSAATWNNSTMYMRNTNTTTGQGRATPTAANLMNTINTRNGTSLRFDKYGATIGIDQVAYTDCCTTTAMFFWVANDGKIYVCFPNGYNWKVSLPGGVKALSLLDINSYFYASGSTNARNLFILGDDGRLYYFDLTNADTYSTSTVPAANDVAKTASSFGTAYTNAATPAIKQFLFTYSYSFWAITTNNHLIQVSDYAHSANRNSTYLTYADYTAGLSWNNNTSTPMSASVIVAPIARAEDMNAQQGFYHFSTTTKNFLESIINGSGSTSVIRAVTVAYYNDAGVYDPAHSIPSRIFYGCQNPY